jgi:P27 family predicted phage terminase small subunit
MRTKPRKPTKLKILEGNRGHRPLPQGEPQPVNLDAPQPPEWLTPYARQEWDRVSEELYAMGVTAQIDAVALAAYAECYSRWRVAEDIIRAAAVADPASGGLVTKSGTGTVVLHPAVGAANKARRDMLRFAAEFGLTPSARAHLEGKQHEDDPVARKYFA